MNYSWTHLLRLATLVVFAVAAVLSIQCEPPRDPEICTRIRIKCLQFEEENCTASGGQFIERGAFCHYCNLCAKFVDANERCNISAGGEETPGGAPLKAVCRAPLICSLQYNGTCVRPEDCD